MGKNGSGKWCILGGRWAEKGSSQSPYGVVVRVLQPDTDLVERIWLSSPFCSLDLWMVFQVGLISREGSSS
jgi:hypothetical protein